MEHYTKRYCDGQPFLPLSLVNLVGEGELIGAPVERLAMYESLLEMEPAEVAHVINVQKIVRCENCVHRVALDRNAELNWIYWHCDILRGEETKNVWHKYSRHYKDYSLVDLDDFCSGFKQEEVK